MAKNKKISDNFIINQLKCVCICNDIETSGTKKQIVCRMLKNDLSYDIINNTIGVSDHLDNFTVPQLKQLCMHYNVPRTGIKKDIKNAIIKTKITVDKINNVIDDWKNKKYLHDCIAPCEGQEVTDNLFFHADIGKKELQEKIVEESTIKMQKANNVALQKYLKKQTIIKLKKICKKFHGTKYGTKEKLIEKIISIENITLDAIKISICEKPADISGTELEDKRKVSEAVKKQVAGKQKYKCANDPKSDIVEDYECPLWHKIENKGCFDESGYEIDHKVEHCISRDDNIKNLQALCKSCHVVKTKRFLISQ